MDKTLELMLEIIAAVFVLYTAAVDPKASLLVAAVAVACLVGYRMIFNKAKKTVSKKTVRTKKR